MASHAFHFCQIFSSPFPRANVFGVFFFGRGPRLIQSRSQSFPCAEFARANRSVGPTVQREPPQFKQNDCGFGSFKDFILPPPLPPALYYLWLAPYKGARLLILERLPSDWQGKGGLGDARVRNIKVARRQSASVVLDPILLTSESLSSVPATRGSLGRSSADRRVPIFHPLYA